MWSSFVLLAILACAFGSPAEVPDFTPCAEDCAGMPDGYYQSCRSCRSYVSCSGGALTLNPCDNDLVWDNLEQSCKPFSKTCSVTEPPKTSASPSTRPPKKSTTLPVEPTKTTKPPKTTTNRPLTTPSPAPKPRCKPGWDFFQNNCYAFVLDKAKFLEALLSCAFDYRAELVKIGNYGEHRFLINVINRRYSNTTEEFWTAANAISTSADNPKWTLAPGGEPATYLNWGQNEPNNAENGQPELCVNLLKLRGYLFNDSNCGRRWSYICKTPANSP